MGPRTAASHIVLRVPAALRITDAAANQRGMALETVIARNIDTSAQSRRFFFWMAVVFVLVAFGGFIPTYWARLGTANFHGPPIMHVHGAFMFTWTLFYLAQTGWVASGRIATHRSWGLAGISLFTLMICSIVVFKITDLRINDAHGFGDAARRFSAITFIGAFSMVVMFVAALANLRRPEIHKRLMYSLMAALMVPAIARVFITLFAPPGALEGGPPPPFVALPPTFVALIFFAVAMIYDWRTQHRWYPAYLYGALVMIVSNTAAVLVAPTQGWLAFAAFMQGLGG